MEKENVVQYYSQQINKIQCQILEKRLQYQEYEAKITNLRYISVEIDQQKLKKNQQQEQNQSFIDQNIQIDEQQWDFLTFKLRFVEAQLLYFMKKFKESEDLLLFLKKQRPNFGLVYFYLAIIQSHYLNSDEFNKELQNKGLQYIQKYMELSEKNKLIEIVILYFKACFKEFQDQKGQIYNKLRIIIEENMDPLIKSRLEVFLNDIQIFEFFIRLESKKEQKAQIIQEFFQYQKQNEQKIEQQFNIPKFKQQYLIARYYDQIQAVKQARQYIEKSQQLNPNYIRTNFLEGIIIEEEQGLQQALDHQLELFKYNKDFVNLYINLSYIYSKLNQFDSEKAILDMGEQKFPECGLINYNRSILYDQIGRKNQDVIDELLVAINKDPEYFSEDYKYVILFEITRDKIGKAAINFYNMLLINPYSWNNLNQLNFQINNRLKQVQQKAVQLYKIKMDYDSMKKNLIYSIKQIVKSKMWTTYFRKEISLDIINNFLPSRDDQNNLMEYFENLCDQKYQKNIKKQNKKSIIYNYTQGFI
ncbi:hypothetical protein PPERSA_07555 [Pseudocohnilembus persalinus]|uniref:Uncharacterized protein n=1 Tax=Pseudocohnilembus persalinus TaxID=266149 RepID=A0A0V0R0C7_PSEPJ|nr:hypothetical protein PPERSA_07555 [Pseudocohnilembus persalinus]|eukprot:KRX07805.1 hypothetical protein PPERSA_07555 [Pseudocohnilembus persalinus]